MGNNIIGEMYSADLLSWYIKAGLGIEIGTTTEELVEPVHFLCWNWFSWDSKELELQKNWNYSLPSLTTHSYLVCFKHT